MRVSLRIGIWLLLLAAVNARGIPMNCSVFHDGSRVGGAGNSSFTCGEATRQLTGFTSNFGNFTGALPNRDQSFPVSLTAVSELVRVAMLNRSVSTMPAGYEFRDSARALVFAGMLTVQQVPEPAGLVLIGSGLLGLAVACRRRRTKEQ